MTIFNLLRADGSIVVNKNLIRNIGLESAIMYSELLSKYYYFEARGQTPDGWFYNSISDMEHDTGLSAYSQRKAIKNLIELNLLLDSEVRGMPATRFFLLNLDESTVVKYLIPVVKNLTPVVENLTQEVKNLHLNNTNKTILKNNTEKNKRDMCEAHGTQKTFFNLPKKEPVKKSRLSHSELADSKISEARDKNDWSLVTDRDFTFYYLKKHNELFSEISFDRYSSVGIIRDSFIKRHDIPKELVCDFIDAILKDYSRHPKRWDSLTFNMLDKQTKLMNELVEAARIKITPPESRFRVNDFTNSSDNLKNDFEQSDGDMYF